MKSNWKISVYIPFQYAEGKLVTHSKMIQQGVTGSFEAETFNELLIFSTMCRLFLSSYRKIRKGDRNWTVGYIFYVYIVIHLYMQQGTTVRISLGTKAVLDDLKIHPKESYDDVIGRLSHLAYDNEPITDEELQAFREGLDDIKTGQTRSLEEIMKDLGDDKIVEMSRKNGVPG